MGDWTRKYEVCVKDGGVAIRKRTSKLIVEEEGVVEAAGKGEAAERGEREREGGRERGRVGTRQIPGNNTK